MGLVDASNTPIISGMSLDKNAEWFEKILDQNNIKFSSTSPLSMDLKNMKMLAKFYKGECQINFSKIDFPNLLRRSFGLDYYIKAVYQSLRTSSSSQILKKLDVFNRGKDVLLTLDSRRSEKRDKAWELLVGALSSPFVQNLSFDEPDVSCMYENIQWGCACKIFYSRNINRQIDIIIEGARQLETSAADFGCVVVNITNLIPHANYFFPISKKEDGLFHSFNDMNIPQQMLADDIQAVIEKIDGERLVKRLHHNSSNGIERQKSRGVIFFAQAISFAQNNPMFITKAFFYSYRKIIYTEQEYTKQFNHMAQTVGTEVQIN